MICTRCNTEMVIGTVSANTGVVVCAILFTIFCFPIGILLWVFALAGKSTPKFVCPACGYVDYPKKQAVVPSTVENQEVDPQVIKNNRTIGLVLLGIGLLLVLSVVGFLLFG